MRSEMIERIRQSLGRELVMRSLVKFFVENGFRESFDVHIYPPLLQSIPKQVPILAEKIEVEPYVDSINQRHGTVQLGWNLFVLGTKRMFLGKTIHRNLTELNQTTMPAGSIMDLKATPRSIIKFVLSVLEDEGEEVQQMPSVIPTVPTTLPRIGSTLSGSYYEKRRPVL